MSSAAAAEPSSSSSSPSPASPPLPAGAVGSGRFVSSAQHHRPRPIGPTATAPSSTSSHLVSSASGSRPPRSNTLTAMRGPGGGMVVNVGAGGASGPASARSTHNNKNNNNTISSSRSTLNGTTDPSHLPLPGSHRPNSAARAAPVPPPPPAPVAAGASAGAALGTLGPGTLVRVGAYTCTIKRYLSQGGFAHVYLASVAQPIPMPPPAKPTTSLVLKRMAVPDKEALIVVRNEVEIHKQLRSHPYIAHFLEASASSIAASAGPNQGSAAGGYEIFILMEFCPGGGLIDLMNARLRNRLRESEILHIFAHVCEGVAHMHHQDPPILHRDLKVENILLVPPPTSHGPPASLASCAQQAETIAFKLCDFGSAVTIRSRAPPNSMDEARALEAELNRHTTLQYRAPEMVDVYRRPPVAIGEPADIWALGILLYKLCYYTTPFEENGGGPLAILNVRYRFPPQPSYSDSLKGLIKSILVERPESRPSIDRLRVNVARLRNLAPPTDALKRLAAEDSSAYPSTLRPSLADTAGRTSSTSITSSSATSSPGLSPSPVTSPSLPPLPARSAPQPSAVSEDLISFRDDSARNGSARDMGPTSAKAEMDRELRELEAHMDTKATMRRGRPVKTAALSATQQPSETVPNVPAKPTVVPKPSFSNVADKVGLWKDLEKQASPAVPQKPSFSSKPSDFPPVPPLASRQQSLQSSTNSKADLFTDLNPVTTPQVKSLNALDSAAASRSGSFQGLKPTTAAKSDLFKDLESPTPIDSKALSDSDFPAPPTSTVLFKDLDKPASPAVPASKDDDMWAELEKLSSTAAERWPDISKEPSLLDGWKDDSKPLSPSRVEAVQGAFSRSSTNLTLSRPSQEPRMASPALLAPVGIRPQKTSQSSGTGSNSAGNGLGTASGSGSGSGSGAGSSAGNIAIIRPKPMPSPQQRSTLPKPEPYRPKSTSSAAPPVASPIALPAAPSGAAKSDDSSPAEEPFRGVSNLIARWQAHAENPDSNSMGAAGTVRSSGGSPASGQQDGFRRNRLPGRDV
ncbi:Ark- serine/threonine protein kinase [Tilletia horrida]|nr:Ark- serine/threonine protein kinase [Tilletia horrida]KAK0567981.1 Ark- serine/threonine protein kinase [Tilletia horrida]